MTDRKVDPRDRIVRPTAEKLPFGPSGTLLLDGPEFPTPRLANDIKFFIDSRQWLRRRSQDAWTDEVQRQLVLTFLSDLFRDNDWPHIWHVEERNTDDRSSKIFAKNPRLIFRITRKRDSKDFEVAIDFFKTDRETDETFRARLDVAGNSLNQQQ